MKREIQDAENIVVFAGRIAEPKSREGMELVSVSLANKKGRDETEWEYLSFSNPKSGQNGTKWADFATDKLGKGKFIVAVCYKKIKGEYTNYYVDACSTEEKGLYWTIKNSTSIAICGTINNIEKKTDSLVLVTVNANGEDHILTFAVPQEGQTGIDFAKLAGYLVIGQVIGCVAREVNKEQFKNLYVSALDFGPKPLS